MVTSVVGFFFLCRVYFMVLRFCDFTGVVFTFTVTMLIVHVGNNSTWLQWVYMYIIVITILLFSK